MTPGKRAVIYAATVAAVMALCIDWDPDEPARRGAMPRHPSAHRPVPGCVCTPCKAMRRGVVLAARPRRAVAAGRPRSLRYQLSDEDVYAGFARIVFAERRKASKDGGAWKPAGGRHHRPRTIREQLLDAFRWHARTAVEPPSRQPLAPGREYPVVRVIPSPDRNKGGTP